MKIYLPVCFCAAIFFITNYWQLLSFLDGLSDLSYRVSVVHLVLTARYDENPKDEKAKQLAHNIQPGALDILLILSI
jgi:hypothetical protein